MRSWYGDNTISFESCERGKRVAHISHCSRSQEDIIRIVPRYAYKQTAAAPQGTPPCCAITVWPYKPACSAILNYRFPSFDTKSAAEY